MALSSMMMLEAERFGGEPDDVIVAALAVAVAAGVVWYYARHGKPGTRLSGAVTGSVGIVLAMVALAFAMHQQRWDLY